MRYMTVYISPNILLTGPDVYRHAPSKKFHSFWVESRSREDTCSTPFLEAEDLRQKIRAAATVWLALIERINNNEDSRIQSGHRLEIARELVE